MIDRKLTLPEANIAQPARSPGILKQASFILKYATVYRMFIGPCIIVIVEE